MENQTALLLQQLAAKLGTTTEYLWRILLRQAPIEATTSIFLIIGLLLIPIFTIKYHIKFDKPRKFGEYREETYYDHYDALGMAMVFIAFAAIIAFFVAISLVPDVVNGYFNPEYWALKHIMDSVKSK